MKEAKVFIDFQYPKSLALNYLFIRLQNQLDARASKVSSPCLCLFFLSKWSQRMRYLAWADAVVRVSVLYLKGSR